MSHVRTHEEKAEGLGVRFREMSGVQADFSETKEHREMVRMRVRLTMESDDLFAEEGVEDEEELAAITAGTVQSKINSLPNKSPGCYNIHNKMLRALPPTGVEALAAVFDKCWRVGIFPGVWKMGIVVPIPKVEKPTSVAEFRPIALLATLGKLFESVVHAKLMLW